MGIARPVVCGHSMGGIVAMLYAALDPGHAAAIVLQSTLARFDPGRLVEGFRRRGGDDIAEIARRASAANRCRVRSGRAPSPASARPSPARSSSRRTGNPELGIRGMELLRALDVRDALQRVDVPTLVCVGALDPVTLVDTARELVAALPRDRTRLEILENAGHFPWLDDPDRYWPLVSGFVRATAGRAGLPG